MCSQSVGAASSSTRCNRTDSATSTRAHKVPELHVRFVYRRRLTHGLVRFGRLHASCPVHEGIKWAANKWVWNQKFY